MKAVAVLILAAAAAAAHAADASEQKASPGRWGDKVFRWSYNPSAQPAWLSAAAARELMIEAAAQWETCGVRMEFLGESAQPAGAMDGANVVGWGTAMPKGVRAITLGRARAGHLLEKDIRFSADRAEFEAHPQLLRKVVMHEFGHAIGLTHSTRCDDVMSLGASCPGLEPAQLPQSPTPRDVQRCRALYMTEPAKDPS